MKCQILISVKNKKNMSAEFAHWVLSINYMSTLDLDKRGIHLKFFYFVGTL